MTCALLVSLCWGMWALGGCTTLVFPLISVVGPYNCSTNVLLWSVHRTGLPRYVMRDGALPWYQRNYELTVPGVYVSLCKLCRHRQAHIYQGTTTIHFVVQSEAKTLRSFIESLWVKHSRFTEFYGTNTFGSAAQRSITDYSSKKKVFSCAYKWSNSSQRAMEYFSRLSLFTFQSVSSLIFSVTAIESIGHRLAMTNISTRGRCALKYFVE